MFFSFFKIVVIATLLMLIVPRALFADEATEDDIIEITSRRFFSGIHSPYALSDSFMVDFSDVRPGITPGSIFSFLDSLSEFLRFSFRSGTLEDKVSLSLEFERERMEEITSLFTRNRIDHSAISKGVSSWLQWSRKRRDMLTAAQEKDIDLPASLTSKLLLHLFWERQWMERNGKILSQTTQQTFTTVNTLYSEQWETFLSQKLLSDETKCSRALDEFTEFSQTKWKGQVRVDETSFVSPFYPSITLFFYEELEDNVRKRLPLSEGLMTDIQGRKKALAKNFLEDVNTNLTNGTFYKDFIAWLEEVDLFEPYAWQGMNTLAQEGEDIGFIFHVFEPRSILAQRFTHEITSLDEESRARFMKLAGADVLMLETMLDVSFLEEDKNIVNIQESIRSTGEEKLSDDWYFAEHVLDLSQLRVFVHLLETNSDATKEATARIDEKLQAMYRCFESFDCKGHGILAGDPRNVAFLSNFSNERSTFASAPQLFNQLQPGLGEYFDDVVKNFSSSQTISHFAQTLKQSEDDIASQLVEDLWQAHDTAVVRLQKQENEKKAQLENIKKSLLANEEVVTFLRKNSERLKTLLALDNAAFSEIVSDLSVNYNLQFEGIESFASEFRKEIRQNLGNMSSAVDTTSLFSQVEELLKSDVLTSELQFSLLNLRKKLLEKVNSEGLDALELEFSNIMKETSELQDSAKDEKSQEIKEGEQAVDNASPVDKEDDFGEPKKDE